jgi:hypothetical protein
VLALTGIFIYASGAAGAQDSFDLDLKELRPAPARREPAARQPRPLKPSPTETTPKAGRESSYTVRPGDNLFLILVRQYGLSNRAAEQLIPEIVRRNGLTEPQKLTVGQRLVIPLAEKSLKAPDISPRKELPAAQPPAATVPAPRAEAPLEREIVLMAVPPCQLARNMANQLGLQIPPLSSLSHPDNVSVGYDGKKMDVSCGLSAAEASTLERLLAPHGVQLLVFNGEVPPRRVVEELADRLGITFRLANEHAPDDLPVTYIFPAANPDEKGVRLTILPAPAVQTP